MRLPAAISFGSSGGPRFSTEIVVTASGHERRNQDWLEARAEYDLAGGIRSEADLATLVAFFRARAGRAFGFRLKDWADFSSAAPGAAISASDQAIGSGDGTTTEFQLVKAYGDGAATHLRTIRKPVAGTVRVALDGVEQTSGWSVDDTTGVISFATPPAAGTAITAGFEFDVPVRFAEDRIAVSLEAFAAGEVPSIRLFEIRL
ncbi:MAG: TIGR02217 family protein [Rhodothalassiaceae bacterium]